MHYFKLIKQKNKEKGHPITFNLLDLWKEQGGRCAILNLPLTIGKDCSLDHIVPISRGGNSSRKNLRFIHQSLNALKANMTDEEFKEHIIKYCPLLIEWANKEKING